MSPERVEPITIVLAVAVVTLVATLVWILVRRRDPKPSAVGVESFRRILVPTRGTLLSERVLALACRLARLDSAEVEVLYVVEVPLALPVDADLPEETEKAGRALDRAREVASAYGVEVSGRVTKARFAGKAIIETASADGADLIVLVAAPRPHGEWGRTVEYVYRNASCDVIVERGQRTAEVVR